MSKVRLKQLQLMEPSPWVTLDTPIDQLYKQEQFTTRTFRAFKTLNCENTRDVLNLQPTELHDLSYIGTACVAELMAFQLRYQHLLVTTNADNDPFDLTVMTIEKKACELVPALLDFSSALPSPARIVLDLDKDNMPKVAVLPLEDDDLTHEITIPYPEPIPSDNLDDFHAQVEQIAAEELEEKVEKKRKHRRVKFLEVLTPDGQLYREKYAYLTFMKFIESVGIERVANLNIVTDKGIPLVSKERIDESGCKESVDGWYIFTGISNFKKAKIINEISALLGLKYVAKSFSI